MIGIICALKIEVDGLKALMENPEITKKAGLEFTSGKIPDVVINSGIAGSLSKNLIIGDIVISTDTVEHDFNCMALDEPRGQIWFTDEKRISMPADKEVCDKLVECCQGLGSHVLTGRIATGDIFVSYRSKREFIAMEFDALCCEMEGGAVGHVCYMNKVPFAILRSISDDFKYNKAENYEDFKELAADRAIKAIKKFIQMD